MRAIERRRQTLRHLARTDGQREEHGSRRWAAEERADQLHGGRVGPVEVVEHEHERLHRRKLLEQGAHRTVAPVALVLQCHRAVGRERRQRREDVRQLGPHVVVEPAEPGPLEPADVLVEGIDEDGERQVALQLGR